MVFCDDFIESENFVLCFPIVALSGQQTGRRLMTLQNNSISQPCFVSCLRWNVWIVIIAIPIKENSCNWMVDQLKNERYILLERYAVQYQSIHHYNHVSLTSPHHLHSPNCCTWRKWFVLCLLEAITCNLQCNFNLNDLLLDELVTSAIIAPTNSPVINASSSEPVDVTTTSTHRPVHLNDVTEFSKALYPVIFFVLTSLLSILGFCF